MTGRRPSPDIAPPPALSRSPLCPSVTQDTPGLTSLTLSLFSCDVGDDGAVALAALRHAPVLRQLALSVSANDVGRRGAKALATLRCAPALTHLDLDLDHNCLEDRGAQALAALKDSPSLTSLTLGLEGNLLGDGAAKALAELAEVRVRRALRPSCAGPCAVGLMPWARALCLVSSTLCPVCHGSRAIASGEPQTGWVGQGPKKIVHPKSVAPDYFSSILGEGSRSDGHNGEAQYSKRTKMLR